MKTTVSPAIAPTSSSKSRAAARLALVGATVVALAGCGAMMAQNPGGQLRPVNATGDDHDKAVMLKGADVTAYFTQGKYVQGNPQFKSVHQGVTFRFASAESKALFDKDPAKYQPQYGGYCANGIVYGIPWGGDADSFRMVDGKLYIFGGAGSKAGFEVDLPKHIALADKYWKEEVAGSNSFVQRFKRLTIRVPHYKSGEEIAREVAAAKGKG
jgi:YHS domain-containing protein